MQCCSGRQSQGMRVAIISLPPKIPAPNIQKPLPSAIWQSRISTHLSGQKVRVGQHRQDVDIDRQYKCVPYGDFRLPSGKIESEGGQCELEATVSWRLLRKVKSYRGL